MSTNDPSAARTNAPDPEGGWGHGASEAARPQKKRNVLLWVALGGCGCLVAIVGLGVLATIVVPNLAHTVHRSQTARAIADIVRIQGALKEYARANQGVYPDSLDALVRPDERGHTFLSGPDAVPLDPWGRPYVYELPSPGHPDPVVRSLGQDGMPGGSGLDADIDLDSIPREHR